MRTVVPFHVSRSLKTGKALQSPIQPDFAILPEYVDESESWIDEFQSAGVETEPVGTLDSEPLGLAISRLPRANAIQQEIAELILAVERRYGRAAS